MRVLTIFLSVIIFFQSIAFSGECIVARTWTEPDGREGKAYYCPPVGIGEPPDLADFGLGDNFEFEGGEWNRQGQMSRSSFNSLRNNPYGQSIFKRSIQAIFSKPALKSPEQERRDQENQRNAEVLDYRRNSVAQINSEFNQYSDQIKEYIEDSVNHQNKSLETSRKIDEILSSKDLDKASKRAFVGLYNVHLDTKKYEGELEDEINTLRYKFWSLEKDHFNSEESRAYLDMSTVSYRAGTKLALNKDYKNARTMLGLSNSFLDIGLGLTPFVGFLKDAYEAYSGKNLITGEPLSTFDRTMSFVGFSLGVASGGTLNAGILKSLPKIFPYAKKAVQAGLGVLDSARKLGISKKYKYGDFTPFKPSTMNPKKIGRQLESRGWNSSQLGETVNQPYKKFKTRDVRYQKNGPKLDDPATGYMNKDGSYVVRNDKTGDIVQINNKNDPEWMYPEWHPFNKQQRDK